MVRYVYLPALVVAAIVCFKGSQSHEPQVISFVSTYGCPDAVAIAPCVCGLFRTARRYPSVKVDDGGILCPSSVDHGQLLAALVETPDRVSFQRFILDSPAFLEVRAWDDFLYDVQDWTGPECPPTRVDLTAAVGAALASWGPDMVEVWCAGSMEPGFLEALGPTLKTDRLSVVGLGGEFPFQVEVLGFVRQLALVDVPSLVEVPVLKFHGLASLVIFYCENIVSIDPGFLVNSPDIEEVAIFGTSVSTIKTGTFQITRWTLFIALDGNEISTIEAGAFQVDDDVSWMIYPVSIRDNQLTTISRGAFEPLFRKGIEVHLAGNPLACDCDSLRWLLEEDYLQLINDGSDIEICGTTLSELTNEALGC